MKLEIFDSKSLNFVELNTTGDNENYNKIDIESKFISSEVFNLFATCFENSNKLYEYFGPTKYNARKIVPLRNELLKNLEQLQNLRTENEFVSHISNIFLGEEFIIEIEKSDKNWEHNWEIYLKKLIELNKQMITIVEKCIDGEHVLWVIGY
jgi:hypothetical protein